MFYSRLCSIASSKSKINQALQKDVVELNLLIFLD